MYVAGVDIGGNSIKFGIFKDGKELVYRSSAKTAHGDMVADVESIAKMVEESGYKIDALGAGTPGTVKLPEGIVWASNLAWPDVPLRKTLMDKLGVPVRVDNDAQTQLYAEHFTGACQGYSSVVYIAFGAGVGGAFLINGKPWRGHSNEAGEIGHIITHNNGLPCACGQKGCYEVYSSANALTRLSGKSNAKEVFDAARADDQAMIAVLKEYLDEVAAGIVSLYRVFCPEVFVLGGGISAAADLLIPMLIEALEVQLPRYDWKNMLRPAAYLNDAGIRGGAAMAVEAYNEANA